MPGFRLVRREKSRTSGAQASKMMTAAQRKGLVWISQIALRMLLGAIMTLPFHGFHCFLQDKKSSSWPYSTAERTWDDSRPAVVNSQLHTGWNHRYTSLDRGSASLGASLQRFLTWPPHHLCRMGKTLSLLGWAPHHIAGAAPRYLFKSSHRSALLALELLNCRKRLSTRAKSVL